MQEAGVALLANWHNFYTVFGTAAATLTGLMFVAITLVASIEVQVSAMNEALSAFNTPTVVNFGAVLLIAGILSAPWNTFASAARVLGLVGVGGVFYLVVVIQRVRRMTAYQTPLKDWFWYSALPLISFLALTGAAVVLPAYPAQALFLIGAVMIMLLFVGIHNAWDIMTYLAIDRSHPEDNRQE